MALKPNLGLTAKLNDSAQPSSTPVLYEAELKEHRQLPSVAARLMRVQRLVDARAQQKV